MRKIRVLVASDEATERKLIAEVIEQRQDFKVAGVAANGKIALAKISQVNPDIIILDGDMPGADSLAIVAEIRGNYRELPVFLLMQSTAMPQNFVKDAVAHGVSEVIPKTSATELTMRRRFFEETLAPRLEYAGKQLRREWKKPVYKPEAGDDHAPGTGMGRLDILAIGVSTGGPNALMELLAKLPTDFPVPVVIVQHMPSFFTSQLAIRLNAKTPLTVKEAGAGDVLAPGCAYIAPGDWHMVLRREAGRAQVDLNKNPPENSCRPAVDVLFRSVAETFGPRALAVVLTGMGQDGLRGCEHIHECGGQVLAQDKESSVVWGMPGMVAEAGLADKVLALPELAAEIAARVSKCRPALSGAPR